MRKMRTSRSTTPWRVAGPVAVLWLTMVAGCLGLPPDAAQVDEALPGGGAAWTMPLVDIGHDHADPALHPETAHGLHRIATLELSATAQAGRMVRADDLLLVSLVGAGAGFAAVDVADPAAPRLLGTYRSTFGASEGEALAVSHDGAHAFLGIETLYSAPGTPPALEVVDLRDPTSPTLRHRLPLPVQPHVLAYFEAGGEARLAVSDYQLSVAASGALPVSAAASTGVTFYTFDPVRGTLTPNGRHTFDATEATPGAWFAHDPVVMEHPLTGERLLYLAAFGGGGRILSLADATTPREVGATLDQGDAPVLRHHSFNPAPGLLGDVLPTAAVPRSRAADGQAHLFLYDTAQPAAPRLLGTWHHPDPDLLPGDDPPLNLHVPVFTKDGSRLLVPHFHAGLFVFDTSTPEALAAPVPIAHWSPAGGDSAVPTAVVMAIEVKGHVLASEAASGSLVVLAWGDAAGEAPGDAV